MAYTPRLTEPSTTDKRWINTAFGGYNRCINVGGGSVIPNCTGYVHGRWMEIGNTNTDYDLSLGNANTYFAHADGFERGQEPRLGAVVCFNGGEAGHVCVVEEIVDADTIVCSESDYSGARFSVRTRYRRYGWRPSTEHTGGFAGFIYHPDVDSGETPPPTPTPETYKITVKGGKASKDTGEAGDTVTLTASIPYAHYFKRWQASSGSLSSPYSATTVFTFSDSDATVTALFDTNDEDYLSISYIFVHHKNKY